MDCPACDAPVDVRLETCPQCGHKMGGYRRGATYFARLAAAYQERQQYHKAVEAWQVVETLKPDHPELDLHRGQVQIALGQITQAIASFQRVLEREPGQLAASLALGEILGQLHRWEEAQAVYDKALATAPKSAQAHLALGQMLAEQSKLKDAFTHIRQATELDPQHGPAWLRLGGLYELAQDLAAASQAYRRAVALLPADSSEGKQARQKLEALNPTLPEAVTTGWFELIRQMAGPVIICALAALLDAGLRPWWIPLTGWAALFLGTLGTFLWVSATALPRNPLIRQLADEPGLHSSVLRVSVAVLGALMWLGAMGLVLLPLDQSIAEAKL